MSHIYLNTNDPALDDLQKKIFMCGKNKKSISYQELVRGVVFNPQKLGANYSIIDFNFAEVAMLGEYLDYISRGSFGHSNFLASALVVGKSEEVPGSGFYDLGRELKLLNKPGKIAELEFWISEVKKAYTHYDKATDHVVI